MSVMAYSEFEGFGTFAYLKGMDSVCRFICRSNFFVFHLELHWIIKISGRIGVYSLLCLIYVWACFVSWLVA